MDNTNNQTNVSQKPNPIFSRNQKRKKKKRSMTRNELTSYMVSIVISLMSIGLSIYYSNYAPEGEKKVIQCTKINGKYQMQLKKLPSVAQFMNHLKYIETKDTTKMWESLYNNKQNTYGGDKLTMLYDYFLTHNYEIKYIIPESEDKFLVWYTFTDFVDPSEVSSIKAFRFTKLKDICEKELPEELIDEVYKYIANRFSVEPDYTKDSVKNLIRNYMNDMSMYDFITKDWRFPMIIAGKLRLKPCQRLIAPTKLLSSDAVSSVEMVCDSANNWRVSRFHTEAISRWN